MSDTENNSGKYIALAIKEISKSIIEKLNSNVMSSNDFKALIEDTIKQMNDELLKEDDIYTQLSLATYNVMLMCLSHYAVLESKVYNKYKDVPLEVLVNRQEVLTYFDSVVRSRLQEGITLKNQQQPLKASPCSSSACGSCPSSCSRGLSSKSSITVKKTFEQV